MPLFQSNILNESYESLLKELEADHSRDPFLWQRRVQNSWRVARLAMAFDMQATPMKGVLGMEGFSAEPVASWTELRVPDSPEKLIIDVSYPLKSETFVKELISWTCNLCDDEDLEAAVQFTAFNDRILGEAPAGFKFLGQPDPLYKP